jgi:hypothetical protein
MASTHIFSASTAAGQFLRHIILFVDVSLLIVSHFTFGRILSTPKDGPLHTPLRGRGDGFDEPGFCSHW